MDRNLAALLAIAETGSISAAAKKINITQPTLTKRLQNLERSHNCKLVERLPRGVKLTRLGKLMLPYAKRIEHEFFQVREELQAGRVGHLDRLRVGAGTFFLNNHLVLAICRLRQEYPRTAILLMTENNNATRLIELADGRIDVVFGGNKPETDTDQIIFHPLATVEHGIAIGRKHPCAQNSVIDVRDLQDTEWIIYSDSREHDNMVANHFKRMELLPPGLSIRTSSYGFGLRMVANGDYVMPVPLRPNLKQEQDGVRFVRTTPPISLRTAGAHMRRSSQSYPIISRLIEIMTELLASEQHA